MRSEIKNTIHFIKYINKVYLKHKSFSIKFLEEIHNTNVRRN